MQQAAAARTRVVRMRRAAFRRSITTTSAIERKRRTCQPFSVMVGCCSRLVEGPEVLCIDREA